jgi:hypothetical protein
MTYSFNLSRRITRLRAPMLAGLLVAAGACDGGSPLDPQESLPAVGTGSGAQPASAGDPSLSTSFSGGIPFGTFALPTSWFGSRYNGAMRNIAPSYLRNELAGIKARGGKVVLMLAGNPRYYKDGSGHFSLDKWKARVARFRNVNFDSYISDGTIIGHYMLDEPTDPTNWNGSTVSGSTLEAMARYSKGIWPGMATVVRAEPGLIKWSQNYHYLDAAWAQYLYRKGDAGDYIRQQVRDAQNMGLQLIIGMNVINGSPSKGRMSASEVRDWGSTLLSNSYPCAFISWQYNSTYLNTSSIEDAMSYLRNKAENRSTKSCRS